MTVQTAALDDRELLLLRLEGALDESAELHGRIKALVGPPDPELHAFGALAVSARMRLRADRQAPLSALECQALELALRLMRPAPLVQDGALPVLPPDGGGQTFPAWAHFCAVIAPTLRSVGRLDRAAGSEHCGTGFLVAPNLVLTNAHVLRELAYGTHHLSDGQAVIRFKLEAEAEGSFEPHPIRRVRRVHPTADLALLELDPIDNRPVFEFATEPPQVGQSIVVVGFPGQDIGRNPYFVPLLFQNRFGLKRAAPGVLLASYPTQLTHDASTLGGNSGSPVLAISSGRVVGVHSSGQFMWHNNAVPAVIASAFVQQNLG